MNSSEVIQSIAEKRANGTASLHMAWKQALEVLPQMEDSQLELIGMSAPSPAALRHFAEYLSRDADTASTLERFFRETRESEETLEDWLSAFAMMAKQLESTSHRPSLGMALGYLHCCEAVISSGERYETFPMTVETMLEVYGYEGEADHCGA